MFYFPLLALLRLLLGAVALAVENAQYSLGGWECPLFPGHPCLMVASSWGNVVAPQDPSAAISAVLPEVSQRLYWVLLSWLCQGEVGSAFMVLFFPSDGSWQASAVTPLYLYTVTGFSHCVHLPVREKYFCSTGPQSG